MNAVEEINNGGQYEADTDDANHIEAEIFTLSPQYVLNILQSKEMRDLNSLAHKFVGLYWIAVIILTSLIQSALNVDINQLTFFIDNWYQKPIVDIITNSHACPRGYENIIDGQFLGTKCGCHCVRQVFWKWNDTYYGPCSHNAKVHGRDKCENVPALYPRRLDRINDRVVCVKRAGPNFLQLNFPFTNCSNGFKPCGPKHDYFVCVPIEQECPITDIQITPLSDATLSEYEAIYFNRSHKLIFTRDKLHNLHYLPIVDFKFEEGQPCIDPDEHPTPLNVEWHKLDQTYNCSVTIEGETRSYRYHEFFSISSFELYSSMKLIDELKKIPGYDVEKFKKYQRSLYWTSWIPWNFECERNTGKSRLFIAEHLVGHIGRVRDIFKSQWHISSLAYYGTSIVAIFSYIIWAGTTSKHQSKTLCLYYVRSVLSILFGSWTIIQVSKLILEIWSLEPSFEFLKSFAHCSDTIANYSLKHTILSLKYNRWADMIALLVLTFTLALDLGNILMQLLVLRFRNKFKKH